MPENSTAARLYRSHRAELVDYARAITGNQDHAEDVVQDAWLHLDRKGDDPGIREPIAYLYRIVRNLAIDTHRRLRRERNRFDDDFETASLSARDEQPDAEQRLIARDDVRLVLQALEALPERQRIAIEMYRFGGFKLREIAEHLDVSIGLVHRLIALGLEACDQSRNSES